MGADSAVLREADIIALRRAAAMAHTIGGITIRLRSAGRVLATVLPAGAHHEPATGLPTADMTAGPVLDSCGFRIAVAKAWNDHRSGQRVALAGHHVSDLEIDWAIARPGRLLGFGAVRTQCAGRLVWAMPSLLAPSDLGAVLEEVDADAGDAPDSLLESVQARLVRDDLLGISVVHVEVDRAAHPQQTAPAQLMVLLDEVICRLVAASAVAELLESVAAVA
ncbi:hypothetical protein [Desertimonas flava]|uniref:hypothetical protein n=1 Tax=Desertimonas flava TaxID=2064846 RepID=UPI000E34D7DC|nr:hypothetical protein [Desertimonas flava]